MTFKRGDMVRLIDPGSNTLLPSDQKHVGKVGTVLSLATDHHSTWPHAPYYTIRLANGQQGWAAERCMRLIPGDPEGREVVDWNWRDMLSKQPA